MEKTIIISENKLKSAFLLYCTYRIENEGEHVNDQFEYLLTQVKEEATLVVEPKSLIRMFTNNDSK